MGVGDNLLSTGIARGASARGKRIAFGDNKQILWDQHSDAIFRDNPNIAPPGSENAPDLEWVHHYKGNRLYNWHDPTNDKWVWNYNFKPIPGEVFLSQSERAWAKAQGRKGWVVIEPNSHLWKTSTANKQWPFERYDSIARLLAKQGYEVRQFVYSGQHRLPYARAMRTPDFRHAMAALARARLYIGPEGGLHHAAAAVAIPAVVLFGGFIPPAVTGYDTHTNLTGGAKACGSLKPCEHCKAAMDAISVDEVLAAALAHLKQEQCADAALV